MYFMDYEWREWCIINKCICSCVMKLYNSILNTDYCRDLIAFN